MKTLTDSKSFWGNEMIFKTYQIRIMSILPTLISLFCVALLHTGHVINLFVCVFWCLSFVGLAFCLQYKDLNKKSELLAQLYVLFHTVFSTQVIMQLQIEHTYKFLLSYQRIVDFILYVLTFLVLTNLFRRKSNGLVFSNLLFFLISSLNLALTVFRGKPVYFPDLFSLRTALDVAGNYSFPFSKVHIICSGIVLMNLYFCWEIRRFKSDLKDSFKINCKNLIMLILIPYVFVSLRIPTWLQWRGYYFTTTEYWYYSFMMSGYQMKVDRPETYDKNDIPIIKNSNQSSQETMYPNVIFVMNESFTDFRVISEFSHSDEVMPFYDNLSNENSVAKGNLHVSIYGGNTANTEFEVLTGVSMNFLPYDSTAYNLYINSPTVNLASYFNDLGYKSIAIHPSSETNYNRTHVYPQFGFSESYFLEDYDNLDFLRTFTSDVSNYQKVIEMFENKRENESYFVFNVTVQNHGPFNLQDQNFQNKVQLDEDYEMTEQFLSCLRYSDEALEYLIDYFQDYSEPVAIVFFGDHQPKIENEFYEKLYDKKLDDLSIEEQSKKYIVPYMIWTNYDVELENKDISSNYLGAYVVDSLGLPMTSYQSFLIELMNSNPIFTPYNDVVNDDTDVVPLREKYQNLCYNLLFDKLNLWQDIFILDK